MNGDWLALGAAAALALASARRGSAAQPRESWLASLSVGDLVILENGLGTRATGKVVRITQPTIRVEIWKGEGETRDFGRKTGRQIFWGKKSKPGRWTLTRPFFKSGSRAKKAWTGPDEAVKQAARTLRSTLSNVTDVLVSPHTIYLTGAPKRLERLLTVHDPETGHLLRSSAWELERLLRGSSAPPGTAKSYIDNANHWHGLFDVVRLFMTETTGDETYWSVQVVPTPGSPQEVTWSAKTGRLVQPESVEPFRFCEAGPQVWMGKPNDPALVLFEKHMPPMFVSHGVDLGDLKAVDDCGGFLWPSFALTWRQPASYGDVVFLAPATVLPRALDKSGKSPFYLAGTDIWSPTARELAQRQTEITAQLRGQSDRNEQNDLLLASSARPDWDNLVGTMSYSFGGDYTLTDKLTSRNELVDALRAILRDHVVESDPYLYPPRPEWSSEAERRYPYAELKVVGLVPVRSMVACLYPKKKARKVNAFLDRHRFAGFRIAFDWTGPAAEDMSKGNKQHDAMRRQWAATVTAAIVAWAANPCQGRNVRMGDGVSSAGLRKSNSDYRAVMQWSKSRPSVDPGFCGTKK